MRSEEPPISYDPRDAGWKESPEIILATVVPEPPPEQDRPLPTRRRWKLPLVLLILTCLSTFVSGSLDGRMAWRSFDPLKGLLYASSIMTILVCHEMGHFLQARRYGVYASYPFFLPMPFSPFGTLGAVIAMDSRIRDRKALFDIGISGPLAGLVPALLFCAIGLHLSTSVSEAEVAMAAATGQGPAWGLGSSILFRLMIGWFHPISEGYYVSLNPMATAGWVGLMITAMNLIPISQLDGGHVLYALIRRGQHVIAGLLLMATITMILIFPALAVWAVMVLLLILMGPKHPPTWDDSVPIGWGRTIVGWLTLAFLFVGFTPLPLVVLDVPRSPKPKVETIEVRSDRPWESERLSAIQLPSDFSGAGMRPPKWTNC